MTDGRVLIELVRDFLSAPRCAVLSTVGTDGAPRQIVIHYLLGENHLLINGHRDRRWVANLRRDPRASLIIHDQVDYLHYVSIRGTAILLDEGDNRSRRSNEPSGALRRGSSRIRPTAAGQLPD